MIEYSVVSDLMNQHLFLYPLCKTWTERSNGQKVVSMMKRIFKNNSSINGRWLTEQIVLRFTLILIVDGVTIILEILEGFLAPSLVQGGASGGYVLIVGGFFLLSISRVCLLLEWRSGCTVMSSVMLPVRRRWFQHFAYHRFLCSDHIGWAGDFLTEGAISPPCFSIRPISVADLEFPKGRVSFPVFPFFPFLFPFPNEELCCLLSTQPAPTRSIFDALCHKFNIPCSQYDQNFAIYFVEL